MQFPQTPQTPLPDNTAGRSLVSSIAMRARSEHRVKKEQQHRLAKEFVANMQERVSASLTVD